MSWFPGTPSNLTNIIKGMIGLPETSEHENKFVPLVVSYHDTPDILKDFQMGILAPWIVKESIYQMLLRVPKYVTCFGMANINGTIDFGVEDKSEVWVGFPSSIEIDKEFVSKLLYSIINKNLKSSNTTDDILNAINIKVIEMEIDECLLEEDKADIIIDDYNNCLLFYEEKMQDYKKKFHSWYQELSFYKQKLRTIVNEPRFRKEVIQFISSHYEDDEYNDYIEHMSIVIDVYVTGNLKTPP